MAKRLIDDVFEALDEQTVVVPGTGTPDVVIPSPARSLGAVHEQRRAAEAQMWRLLVGPRVGRGVGSRIVPDGLWEFAEPLIPLSKVRPRGGGTQDTPDETPFAAVSPCPASGAAQ